MRRRLAIAFAPFVVGLALLLPATTLATTLYTHVVNKNYCTSYPANVLKVTFTAKGSGMADGLTIDSKGQSGQPGNWTTYTTWPQKYLDFVPDGTNHTLTLQRKYLGDAFSRNRIVFTLRAWAGTAQVYSHKIVSKVC